MTQTHPLTPPPELVQQWIRGRPTGEYAHTYIATQAAQWGADQELEACCEWLRSQHHSDTWPSRLRAARRPKPTTLKEQALELVSRIEKAKSPWELSELETIRRALEALND
jgi:hypothetical protein